MRFAEVLAEADRAAIIDIWAVRDPDTTITSAAALADATTRVAREPAHAIGSARKPGRPGWPTTWNPATSCWSWVADARTSASRPSSSEHLAPTVARTRAGVSPVSASAGRSRCRLASPRPTGRAYSWMAFGGQARPGRQLPLPAVQGAGHDTRPRRVPKRVRSAFMCGQRRWTCSRRARTCPGSGRARRRSPRRTAAAPTLRHLNHV